MQTVQTHLEVSDEAEIEKNVALAWAAIHFPINVLPVPGGPNRRRPFGGSRTPDQFDRDGSFLALLFIKHIVLNEAGLSSYTSVF